MTKAKGSDVRAACEAAMHEINDHAFDPAYDWPQYVDVIERHIASFIEARVQAAAFEMRERCTNHSNLFLNGDSKWQCECGEIYGNVTTGIYAATIKHKQHIRVLPIPADALDAMLLRARIEGAEEAIRTDENDLCYGHRYIRKQKRKLAALTRCAAERKEK